MIDIVIPHLGRDHLLAWHLRELNKQTYDDFAVIIVLDEQEREDMVWYTDRPAELYQAIDGAEYPCEVLFSGATGPGNSRNIGAEHSKADTILILGSDCIPDKHLVARHVYNHLAGADIVQGYTPFHQDTITPFYDFLDSSGLQAAWSNLKDEQGNWRKEISPAFCLTTNWSIKRRLLLNEPFDKRFKSAAWEDVEEGHRLSKHNDALKTIFDPLAINYHYHRYNFASWLRRCRMEGYHRLTYCKIHPEMGWGLVNPFELRKAKDLNEAEIIAWATELDSVRSGESEDKKELMAARYSRYLDACKLFSLKGVLDRIKDEHPAMQALQHVHSNAQVIQILSGVAALEEGALGYAAHCKEWFMNEREDDWSAFAFAAEIERACGNEEESVAAARKSLLVNPGAEWPKGILE